MEDDINGRRAQLKTTPMKDDLSIIFDSTFCPLSGNVSGYSQFIQFMKKFRKFCFQWQNILFTLQLTVNM